MKKKCFEFLVVSIVLIEFINFAMEIQLKNHQNALLNSHISPAIAQSIVKQILT